MKISRQCIYCLAREAVKIAEEATKDVAMQEKIIKRSLKELEQEKVHVNNQLILLKQKRIDAEQRIKGIYEEIENTKNQFNRFIKNISDIEKDLQESESNFRLVINNINNDNIFLERYNEVHQSLNRVMKFIENKYQKSVNYCRDEYREDKIKIETVISSVESSLLITKNEIADITDMLTNNEKSSSNIEKNIDYYKKEVRQLKENKWRIEEEIEKYNLSIDDDNRIIQEFNNNIILKSKEKEFLEELIKNNSGNVEKIDENIFYKNGFQNVKLLKEIDKFIQDIPINLKSLIKLLLKNNLQLLKIKNIENIADLNKLIKENNLGQIRIISDNIFNNNIKSQKIYQKDNFLQLHKNEMNIIGFANQLITYAHEYDFLFECLLGDIIVVEDTERALDLCRKVQEQWKIVTLDGLLIEPNGVLLLNIFAADDITNNTLSPKEKIIQLRRDIQGIYSKKNEYQCYLIYI